jgi:hypothetical protein
VPQGKPQRTRSAICSDEWLARHGSSHTDMKTSEAEPAQVRDAKLEDHALPYPVGAIGLSRRAPAFPADWC